MGLIGWLVALGCLFIGAAIGVWGLTEFNKLVAIWGIALPGAAFLVLAGCFELQTFASDTKIDRPSDTEIKKTRAYVFIDTIKTRNIDDNVFVVAPDLIPSILVVVKNTGQTPAFKFTHRIAARFDTWPPPNDLFKAALVPPAAKDTLPSGVFAESTVTLSRNLSVDEKTKLKQGSHAVYLFGEIGYEDVFGIKRCTRYRYRVGGDVGFSGTGMVPMAEGYEVDQDCG
jgi:hypothetical protein